MTYWKSGDDLVNKLVKGAKMGKDSTRSSSLLPVGRVPEFPVGSEAKE